MFGKLDGTCCPVFCPPALAPQWTALGSVNIAEAVCRKLGVNQATPRVANYELHVLQVVADDTVKLEFDFGKVEFGRLVKGGSPLGYNVCMHAYFLIQLTSELYA